MLHSSMSSPTNNQRLDWIDALRGFAALWVFLYHIWNAIYPWGNSQVAPVAWDGTQPWHYYFTFFLFQYGYYGVTIFFVVSGFCIHLPQARKHAATGSDGLKLEPFFQRRFWRLYPAYFGSLFIAALCLGAMRLMQYRHEGWKLPLPDHFYEQAFGLYEIGYNALFLLPFIESAKDLNSVLWTLVFEVQFYLIYPLLLWVMRRVGLLPVGILLFLLELWFTPTARNRENFMDHDPWAYFFLARYFEWFLGVVAAELLVRRKTLAPRRWLLILTGMGLLYSGICVFIPLLWPTRDLAVASTTFLFLLCVLPSDAATAHQAQPLFRLFIWLGIFSYSLYLLHMPLLRLMTAGNELLAEQLGHPTWSSWMILDSIPVVILASWGFYWLLERPFMKTK